MLLVTAVVDQNAHRIKAKNGANSIQHPNLLKVHHTKSEGSYDGAFSCVYSEAAATTAVELHTRCQANVKQLKLRSIYKSTLQMF